VAILKKKKKRETDKSSSLPVHKSQQKNKAHKETEKHGLIKGTKEISRNQS
jgi:hypothetical protein